MADKVTTIRVREEDLAYFDEIAQSTGESRTEVMYRALIAGREVLQGVYNDFDHPLFGPILKSLAMSKRFAELMGDDPKEYEARAKRLRNRDNYRKSRNAKPS